MKRVLLLATFQLLAILGWAGYHEYVRATAPTFRIPLRLRDPFDLLRGRYFALNPRDSSIDLGSTLAPHGEIASFLGSESSFVGSAQVGFCPEKQVYRICALRRPGEGLPAGPARFWSKGFVELSHGTDGWKLRIDLGLHRFFIPNRLQLPGRENEPGWELEVSHRPGLSLLPRRLFFKGVPVEVG